MKKILRHTIRKYKADLKGYIEKGAGEAVQVIDDYSLNELDMEYNWTDAFNGIIIKDKTIKFTLNGKGNMFSYDIEGTTLSRYLNSDRISRQTIDGKLEDCGIKVLKDNNNEDIAVIYTTYVKNEIVHTGNLLIITKDGVKADLTDALTYVDGTTIKATGEQIKWRFENDSIICFSYKRADTNEYIKNTYNSDIIRKDKVDLKTFTSKGADAVQTIQDYPLDELDIKNNWMDAFNK